MLFLDWSVRNDTRKIPKPARQIEIRWRNVKGKFPYPWYNYVLKVVFNFMLPLITGLNCLLGNDKSDASGVYHRVCQSNCRWWMPRREIPGWTSLVPFHNLFQVLFPWYSRVEQPFIFNLDKINLQQIGVERSTEKILHLITKWRSVLNL